MRSTIIVIVGRLLSDMEEQSMPRRVSVDSRGPCATPVQRWSVLRRLMVGEVAPKSAFETGRSSSLSSDTHVGRRYP